MGLKAPVGSNGKDFTPAPEGLHVARCYRVIDLGTHYSERWEKSSRKVVIAWELPEELHEYEVDGEQHERPFSVSKWYTLSCHEKASLRQDLESWYGKSFNDAELRAAGGFDLEKVLGRPAMVNVAHHERDGKVFANVKSVNPLPKSTECPEAVNEALLFSLQDFDRELFEDLPEGYQDWIRKSEEYQSLKASGGEYSEKDPPPVTDDDIPF